MGNIFPKEKKNFAKGAICSLKHQNNVPKPCFFTW